MEAIEGVESTKRNVDVVLSDMCEPWPLVGNQSHKRHLKDPFFRLMNTSGNAFRDHAGSMASPPTLCARIS